MDRDYWLDRQQQALVMAQSSSSPEGHIVHTELARRYGVQARASEGSNERPADESTH